VLFDRGTRESVAPPRLGATGQTAHQLKQFDTPAARPVNRPGWPRPDLISPRGDQPAEAQKNFVTPVWPRVQIFPDLHRYAGFQAGGRTERQLRIDAIVGSAAQNDRGEPSYGRAESGALRAQRALVMPQNAPRWRWNE